MFDPNEFLDQIIPLFVQAISIPTLVATGYFGYRQYKKRTGTGDATVATQTATNPTPETAYDDYPNFTPTNKSNLLNQMEDEPMTENNQPMSEQEQPAAQSKRIDTGDLPPLDMLLGNLEAEPEPEPEPTPKPDAPPQIVQLKDISPDTAYVQLNTGQIAPAQEIISILRDDDDGRLLIQVGNTGYRTLADSADIKLLFTQIMKELAGTITKPDSNPPVRKRYVVGEPEVDEPIFQQTPNIEPPVQSDMPSIRDLLVDNDPVPAKPVEPKRERPKAPAPPPPKHGAPMPGDLPSYKLEDNPLKAEKKGRFGGQKMEAEPVPELDLAAAIETYLQYKLQHTPDYMGRAIHIHGTPSGAIRIQVDQDYYDFVDEVADTEIRQFLQDTIAEWQERQ